jgi:signal transduction histidine kinase
VASPASSIRSAARATSCALRRVPIRWRLAGGSAALTLVILLGFAVVVGALTQRRLEATFDQQVDRAAEAVASKVRVRDTGNLFFSRVEIVPGSPPLDDYLEGPTSAVRVVTLQGEVLGESRRGGQLPRQGVGDVDGWRVEVRALPVESASYNTPPVFLQYGRRLSEVEATARLVRAFLGLGVLGGAALALLAGLATARRAMSPIAELTEAARTITRTRDPSVRLPRSESDDEVAELARTLEDMLRALDQARGETEAALDRQREFVADASHELRTPLTSVLANLELLVEELEGEQRAVAASALRSSRRMRRLVADLLLLARADTGRARPHEAVDLSEVVTEAAGELEPVAEEHPITVSAPPGLLVSGARDELHRLALNLLENALRHTDPHTAIEVSLEPAGGEVVLAVEDDGPGIPPELREKVFERFFRGAGDRSGSSGLGLAIVQAVAESHGGSVSLVEPLDGRGARFVVRIPALGAERSSPLSWTGAREA